MGRVLCDLTSARLPGHGIAQVLYPGNIPFSQTYTFQAKDPSTTPGFYEKFLSGCAPAQTVSVSLAICLAARER
jgi:hypothetical protein